LNQSPAQKPFSTAPTGKSQAEAVAFGYEHNTALPELLEQLGLSLLLSTYQAGRVVSLGVLQGQLRSSFPTSTRLWGFAVPPRALLLAPAMASGHSLPPDNTRREFRKSTHDIAFCRGAAATASP